MKRMKRFPIWPVLIIALILAMMIPFSLLGYGPRAVSRCEVGDSCDSLREDIHDTAEVLRVEMVDTTLRVLNDTTPILRAEMIDSAAIVAHDTAEVLRVEMIDSTLRVLNDTTPVLRAEMIDSAAIVAHDTAEVLRAEMPDSVLRIWNDSVPIVRAEMIDSTLRVLNDTTPVLRAEMIDSAAIVAHDTAEVLRVEMIDSAAIVAHDTAEVLRVEMVDTTLRILNDTTSILRANMGDSARVAAGDTAVVLRGNIGDTCRQGQWIIKDYIDTTSSNIPFNDAYRITTAEADSLLATIGTAKELITDSLDEYLPLVDFDDSLTADIDRTINGTWNFTNGLVTDDTLVVDTALWDSFRIMQTAPTTIAIEERSGKGVLFAFGNTAQTTASGISVTDGGANKPGWIAAYAEDGNAQYGWFDENHILRVKNGVYADPDADGYTLIDADDGHLYAVNFTASGGADVAANASFGNAFHEDTTEADSAYITKGTFDLIADDTTGWAKKAADETISGQWEHSDTLEMTDTRPIAWINTGNDTGRVWMADNDTLYMQATTGKIKVGSSIIVNAAGDVTATGGMDIVAKVSADAFYVEDTTEADSALITAYTGQLLIEDSLNEYTLLTDFGKVTDDTTAWNAKPTAADFGKVTDDTTNYQSAYSMTSGATTQWVTGAMIDSTANPVIFSAASHVTSAEADSAYVTKGYADAHDVTNDVYVRAYLATADQAIAYNTWTQVALNAELVDLGNDFNTTTNEFTAPDSGFYMISARANVQDNGGATDEGGSLVAIYRNDSMMVRGTKLIGYTETTGDITDLNCGPVVNATLYCPASATIQIYAYQDFQDTGGGFILKTAEESWVTIRKVN